MQLLLAYAEYFWTNHPSSDAIFEPLHCAITALAVSTPSVEIEENEVDRKQKAHDVHRGEMA